MEAINIVALEIGSSKVKGAVGSVDADGILTVQSVDEEPIIDSVRYGIVSNVEEVASMTQRILSKIENRISPRKVDKVYISIGGRSFASHPYDIKRLLPDEREVTSALIEQLKGEARNASIPERELLDVVPCRYYIDNRATAKPVGTFGRNIRIAANLIVCRPQVKRNLVRLIEEKLGLQIAGYSVRQLAQGRLALTAEERQLGCMLVDFGAETTAVSIYREGALQYYATLPLGSRNITRDIKCLNYLEEKAENIKMTAGNAGTGNTVNPHSATPGIDYSAVNSYVSNRAGEIIANINEQLALAGLKPKDLPAGIIIVGRGARLAGFNERLQQVTGLKVRSGSIADSNVRISDSRISPSDAIDVIATMTDVIDHGARECFRIQQEPEPEPTVETTPDTVEDDTQEVEIPIEHAPKRSAFARWVDKFNTRIDTILNESDEDGDDVLNDDDDDYNRR